MNQLKYHLGSKAVEVDSAGNIIDYVLYSPFGEPLKKNNYQPQWNECLGYIDKEKDRESRLGDHGVRKYDYEIGRFTSVDPLWEKYTGWTGYQYSLNNPVNYLDRDGKKVTNNLTDGSPMSNLINDVYAKSPTFKTMFDALQKTTYPITYKFGELPKGEYGTHNVFVDKRKTVIAPGVNIPPIYEKIEITRVEIIIDNNKNDIHNEVEILGHETNHGHQLFLSPLIFWRYDELVNNSKIRQENNKLETGGEYNGFNFQGSYPIGLQIYGEYIK